VLVHHRQAVEPIIHTALHSRHLEAIALAQRETRRSGTGRVVLVEGPTGAGKSTVLAAALTELSRCGEPPVILAGGFATLRDPGRFAAHRIPDGPIDLDTALSVVGQGRSGGERCGPDVRLSAQETHHLAGQVSGTGRTVVLVLDDLQAAAPCLPWSGLFLSRWLPRLAASRPVLVVAGCAIDPAPSAEGGLSELGAAFDTLAGRGLLDRQPLALLGRDDLERWFGPVDDLVAADLLGLSGGHPGWAGRLFAEWREGGKIAGSAQTGAWTYTPSGRDEAWTRPEAHDRRRTVLATAALEGPVFTAAALAHALGEDTDELIDFIDDHLIGTVQEVAFLTLDERYGVTPARQLFRYRFGTTMDWYMSRPTTVVPEVARRYAEGLVRSYGPGVWLVARHVAHLARRARDHDTARLFDDLGDSTAVQDTYRQIIEEELRRARTMEPYQVSEALAAARRLIRAGDATDDGAAAAYDLAFHLTAKLPFPAARALNARAAAAREAPARRG
jgi:hypothetical protein